MPSLARRATRRYTEAMKAKSAASKNRSASKRPTTIADYIRAAPHLNFSATSATLEAFRKDLAKHQTTKHFLQVPYSDPLPEALIRKLAKHRLRVVREADSDGFW